MDIVKQMSANPQSVAPATPTTMAWSASSFLISNGGDSLQPFTNCIWVKKAGYYLVSIEVQVIGTGTHKMFLKRDPTFPGPSTETLEFTGTAGGVDYGRTVIIKVSADTFLFLEALHDAGANRDYTASLCVAKLAGV